MPDPLLAARNSGSVDGSTPDEGSLLQSKLPLAADRVRRGLATYTRVRTTTPPRRSVWHVVDSYEVP